MNSTFAIKSLRGKRLKSQEDIAKAIGVSRQVYNGYENDIIHCELNLVYKILKVLEANEQEVNDFLFAVKQDFLSYKNK